jgi:hypothetical protein
MAETWRQEHRRLGRPVRGHRMSYRDVIGESAGNLGFIPVQDKERMDEDATVDYYEGKMSPEQYNEIIFALWGSSRMPDESTARREAVLRRMLDNSIARSDVD